MHANMTEPSIGTHSKDGRPGTQIRVQHCAFRALVCIVIGSLLRSIKKVLLPNPSIQLRS